MILLAYPINTIDLQDIIEININDSNYLLSPFNNYVVLYHMDKINSIVTSHSLLLDKEYVLLIHNNDLVDIVYKETFDRIKDFLNYKYYGE